MLAALFASSSQLNPLSLWSQAQTSRKESHLFGMYDIPRRTHQLIVIRIHKSDLLRLAQLGVPPHRHVRGAVCVSASHAKEDRRRRQAVEKWHRQRICRDVVQATCSSAQISLPEAPGPR